MENSQNNEKNALNRSKFTKFVTEFSRSYFRENSQNTLQNLPNLVGNIREIISGKITEASSLLRPEHYQQFFPPKNGTYKMRYTCEIDQKKQKKLILLCDRIPIYILGENWIQYSDY